MDTAKAVKAWLSAGSYEALKRGAFHFPEAESLAPEKIASPQALKDRALRQRGQDTRVVWGMAGARVLLEDVEARVRG